MGELQATKQKLVECAGGAPAIVGQCQTVSLAANAAELFPRVLCLPNAPGVGW